jgi:filamentous hemagglutinin
VSFPKGSGFEIARRKVTHYLLATAHPVGGSKARYFESRGYHVDRPEVFEASLELAGADGKVLGTEATEWGTKYYMVSTVPAPDGNPMTLGTVWMVDNEGGRPVLVTAYPGGK